MTSGSRDIAAIATAFSGHRFTEAYDALAPDARWVLVGEDVLAGRDAIVAACEASAAHLATVTTTFPRFVVVTGADAAAVDAIGVYTDDAGQSTTVSSCDVYEFRDGQVTAITSYTVELPEG